MSEFLPNFSLMFLAYSSRPELNTQLFQWYPVGFFIHIALPKSLWKKAIISYKTERTIFWINTRKWLVLSFKDILQKKKLKNTKFFCNDITIPNFAHIIIVKFWSELRTWILTYVRFINECRAFLKLILNLSFCVFSSLLYKQDITYF